MCVQAATRMANDLRANNQRPLFAEIHFRCQGRVYSSTGRFGPNTPISFSGYHVGVLQRGIVHCNVHPEGRPIQLWFNDFWTPHSVITQTPPMRTVSPFPLSQDFYPPWR